MKTYALIHLRDKVYGGTFWAFAPCESTSCDGLVLNPAAVGFTTSTAPIQWDDSQYSLTHLGSGLQIRDLNSRGFQLGLARKLAGLDFTFKGPHLSESVKQSATVLIDRWFQEWEEGC